VIERPLEHQLASTAALDGQEKFQGGPRAAYGMCVPKQNRRESAGATVAVDMTEGLPRADPREGLLSPRASEPSTEALRISSRHMAMGLARRERATLLRATAGRPDASIQRAP
jgi:hypothetical protein